MKQKINFLISFFVFNGYYLGLILIIYLGFMEQSRYYSFPLRLIILILMIYKIVKLKFNYLSSSKISFIYFGLFWTLYFLAIFKAMVYSSDNFYLAPIEYMAYSIGYSIVPFLFFSLFQGDYVLNIFKNAIIISGVLLAVVSYLLYGQLLLMGVGRISMVKYMQVGIDEVISPLALSYVSSLVITICLYYLLFTKLTLVKKMYYSLSALVSLVPFFLGASRGSVVAIILTFIVIVIVKGSKKKKIQAIILLILLGFFIDYTATEVKSSVVSRVMNITGDIEVNSDSAVRLYLWESAWEQFLNSPIWGDSIKSKIPPYPHNIFLEVLMSVGIIGFIPFGILFYRAMKKSLKLIKSHRDYTWVFILFFQGFIQYQFSGAVYAAIFFWGGMGLVFSVKLFQNDRYNIRYSLF